MVVVVVVVVVDSVVVVVVVVFVVVVLVARERTDQTCIFHIVCSMMPNIVGPHLAGYLVHIP